MTGTTQGGKPVSHLSEADQRNFETAFYEGNKQMVLGNHNEAIVQFKKCTGIDPLSDAAQYLLGKEYNATRQFSLSLPCAKEAVRINDKIVWYHLLLADNLKHVDRNFEAGKELDYIAEKFKGHESNYLDAAECYIIAKKFTEALHSLDKMEKLTGVSEDISFKKEDLYLKLQKKDAAIAELEKLIAAFPKRYRYRVALAEVYFNFKEEAKAKEILQQLLTADPSMPEAHLLLSHIYQLDGETSKALEELKVVFANPDADVKQKINILTSYAPMMEFKPAIRPLILELGNLLVTTHPENDACNAIYGDILYNTEHYPEARTYYLKALKNAKSNYNLWQNLLLCEDELNLYDEAIKHADEAIEAFPSQAIFYYYKALFAYRLKDYTTAAATADAGYDIGSDRSTLLIQLLSIAGNANHELKKYTESDAACEKILELDPNNLETLNNYSYYLSLRKEKLDRAEAMSKKTLELDPNNASYLDTYGWILYQQKKYADAKVYIEQALLKEPDNGVLNEHFGDVCFQLNETDKALFYWKKAKEKGDTSQTLNQKINTGKLIE
jgi:tetratricopeptide (TPR) repeat protein